MLLGGRQLGEEFVLGNEALGLVPGFLEAEELVHDGLLVGLGVLATLISEDEEEVVFLQDEQGGVGHGGGAVGIRGWSEYLAVLRKLSKKQASPK